MAAKPSRGAAWTGRRRTATTWFPIRPPSSDLHTLPTCSPVPAPRSTSTTLMMAVAAAATTATPSTLPTPRTPPTPPTTPPTSMPPRAPQLFFPPVAAATSDTASLAPPSPPPPTALSDPSPTRPRPTLSRNCPSALRRSGTATGAGDAALRARLSQALPRGMGREGRLWEQGGRCP
ncbi:hypothetical protein DFJ73DRAFT_881365, partial [Zopfochytrium polystomum]